MELIEKKAAPRYVGLKPLSIDHELRNGSLADVTKYFCGCGGIGVDIDLGIANAVRIEKLLGCPAVPAP
jgi:hypothetical protein